MSPIRCDTRPHQDWVAFDFTPERPARGFERIHRAWSRYEYKSDGYAEGRFGMTPQALAGLMNAWRERYSSTESGLSLGSTTVSGSRHLPQNVGVRRGRFLYTIAIYVSAMFVVRFSSNVVMNIVARLVHS